MPAVANVIRFKSKSLPVLDRFVYAARFDGSPESVAAILEVARKCDSDAVVAVVPELDVLVVRWEPARRIDYKVVKLSDWLAFSEWTLSIYSADDGDLECWYERA